MLRGSLRTEDDCTEVAYPNLSLRASDSVEVLLGAVVSSGHFRPLWMWKYFSLFLSYTQAGQQTNGSDIETHKASQSKRPIGQAGTLLPQLVECVHLGTYGKYVSSQAACERHVSRGLLHARVCIRKRFCLCSPFRSQGKRSLVEHGVCWLHRFDSPASNTVLVPGCSFGRVELQNAAARTSSPSPGSAAADARRNTGAVAARRTSSLQKQDSC